MKVQAVVGFAAGPAGNGIAYVRLAGRGAARMLRVPFTFRRYPALLGREAGYAAVTAVSGALRRRGIQRVNLAVDDARLVGDLREHRELPAALTLPYVRLRCALNQFQEYDIAEARSGAAELTARARSEVAMHAAA